MASFRFGEETAISTSGTKFVATAPGYGEPGSPEMGSISTYLYEGSGDQGPVWAPKTKTDGPRAFDRIGTAVALSGKGNVLVAAAKGSDQWNCWVSLLDWTENGWEHAQMITRDRTGTEWIPPVSVASDAWGNRIAIGSPLEGVNGKGNQGAVFIYQRWGKIWELEHIVTLKHGASNAFFGSQIALSDDGHYLAVSSFYDDDSFRPEEPRRTVLVYRGRLGFEHPISLTGQDAKNDYFGTSLALSDDGSVLAIGSKSFSEDLGGGIYFYEKAEGGYLSRGTFFEAELDRGDGKALPGYLPEESTFGHQLALSGDGKLAVCSNTFGFVDGIGADAGWIAPFRDDPEGGWTQEPLIWDRGHQTPTEFGYGLSIAGDGKTMLAASPQELIVFRRRPGFWKPQQALIPHF